jgi:hypothetical protein
VASASARTRLRLNLLPPEIPAARRAKRLFPLCLVLILASGIGTLGWWAMWGKAVKDHTDKLADVKTKADAVTTLEGQITTEKGKQEPLKAIIKFLDGFETQASKYPDVVEALAHYVPDTCTLDRIEISGTTVTFSTVVEDTEALVRLCINLNRAAMPQKGGGTEPLWSDDAVSRGKVKPLFSGPIQVSGVTMNGMRLASNVYPEGDVASQLLSFGPRPSAAPTVATGDSVYQNGMIWQAPIPVTITATLAEPVGFELPQVAAPPAADASAGTAAAAPAAGGSGGGTSAGTAAPAGGGT